MSDLLNKKCVPCEGGVIPFDISEIHKYQKKVDGWDIIKDKKEIYLLEKKFDFLNFVESEEFVSKVGKISEKEGHHPDINFGCFRVDGEVWIIRFDHSSNCLTMSKENGDFNDLWHY